MTGDRGIRGEWGLPQGVHVSQLSEYRRPLRFARLRRAYFFVSPYPPQSPHPPSLPRRLCASSASSAVNLCGETARRSSRKLASLHWRAGTGPAAPRWRTETGRRVRGTAEDAENRREGKGDRGMMGDKGTRVPRACGAQSSGISISPIIPASPFLLRAFSAFSASSAVNICGEIARPMGARPASHDRRAGPSPAAAGGAPCC